jgi:hypothetical protein
LPKPLWLAGCATIQSFADGYRLITVPFFSLISRTRHSSLAVKITIMKLILAAHQLALLEVALRLRSERDRQGA